MSCFKNLFFLFTLTTQTFAFYTVDNVVHESFLEIKGQKYEVSSDCQGKFVEIGDEVLFTSISATGGHCDLVQAKNTLTGQSCELLCL